LVCDGFGGVIRNAGVWRDAIQNGEGRILGVFK
jgi:hypothetical protein